MTEIAVLYGTTEGQTAKIARHIAHRLQQKGQRVEVQHIAELDPKFDLKKFSAVVVGASIHEGRHQSYVEDWITTHRESLGRMKSAFFSVCLAINSKNESERLEASEFPLQMQVKTHWHPEQTAVFAGALMYTQYNWLKRIALKYIAKHEGGSTDTATDHEYTDWQQVDAFTDALLVRVERGVARA
jgi:menaquinone-dependent protoporphyrinogen oxidase